MIFDSLLAQMESHPESAGVRFFEKERAATKSYRELTGDVRAAILALRALGVEPGMRVGILGANSYAWIVADLALIEIGACSVAFGDDARTNLPEELQATYALSILLVDRLAEQTWSDRAPWIVPLDTLRTRRGPTKVAVDPGPDAWLPPEELSWVFSSGTSGGLKCLAVSRAGTSDLVRAIGPAFDFGVGDAFLLFLPLANYQQRFLAYACMWHGMDLVLSDFPGVFRAFKTFRPTAFLAPPVFYESLAARIHNAPPRQRALLQAARAIVKALPTTKGTSSLGSALLDRARKPIADLLGGRVRLMITGMAPIRRATLDLFADLGLPLYEAYGLTECGPIAWNAPSANRLGSVGKPAAGVQLSFGPDGEVFVEKRSLLTLGYRFYDEALARETYLGESRIATGDIGHLDADGFLHLTGRKKEILVTRSGHKLHPEVLEGDLGRCPLVRQAVVLMGDAPNQLVAVVSVAEDTPDVRRKVQDEVTRVNGGLQIDASIAHVVFTTTAFTVDNGCLTANLKLNRRGIAKAFARQAGDHVESLCG